LGTVFLEEYGVGFAIENSTLGFDGYVQHLPPDGKPSKFSGVPLWAIIILSLIAVTAIIASATVCIKQKKRKNQAVIVEQNNVLMISA
jgi:hypothetical protein